MGRVLALGRVIAVACRSQDSDAGYAGRLSPRRRAGESCAPERHSSGGPPYGPPLTKSMLTPSTTPLLLAPDIATG